MDEKAKSPVKGETMEGMARWTGGKEAVRAAYYALGLSEVQIFKDE